MSVRLFVGGLSFSTSTDGLRDAFARFGPVQSAAVMTDRETGRSRGFGFVEMTNDQEAEKAIAGLNGSSLDGRMIRVDRATPRGAGGAAEAVSRPGRAAAAGVVVGRPPPRKVAVGTDVVPGAPVLREPVATPGDRRSPGRDERVRRPRIGAGDAAGWARTGTIAGDGSRRDPPTVTRASRSCCSPADVAIAR